MTVTANPARILGLPRKGRIKEGMDADLVILGEDERPEYVIARGNLTMDQGRITRKDTYS